MGTYYPHHVTTRRELIEYLCEDRNEKYTMARRYCCGNVLWILWQPTGEPVEYTGYVPFIECNLLSCYRHDGETDWGYKPMDESMGPFYWSCPLAFLDAAPVQDAEWREAVHAYWRRRKEVLRRKRGLPV